MCTQIVAIWCDEGKPNTIPACRWGHLSCPSSPAQTGGEHGLATRPSDSLNNSWCVWVPGSPSYWYKWLLHDWRITGSWSHWPWHATCRSLVRVCMASTMSKQGASLTLVSLTPWLQMWSRRESRAQQRGSPWSQTPNVGLLPLVFLPPKQLVKPENVPLWL